MKKIGYYLLFLGVMACGSGASNTSETKKSPNAFEVIYKSTYNGLPQKKYYVIDNNEDLKVLFSQMKEDQVPAIDFKDSNVVVLNMGQKNTGGYDVYPEKILDEGNTIVLTIKEVSPGPGDMVTTALTNPVCVVKVNSKKEIIIK
ncbi:protease complex subunit PrcB family protein [Flavobacterium humi]|uniref:Protease complex subunit PrcB family protein n=1 Tax=Flavobacterium humi TaxID=2562683 RepID=A0A4Z0LC54_9FLAO|nr:protease complex subunit PrcB family protein [Flavobacterium humi]TGD59448.1 protease complex subunit PrcB family protein [Flavobacterium humi]